MPPRSKPAKKSHAEPYLTPMIPLLTGKGERPIASVLAEHNQMDAVSMEHIEAFLKLAFEDERFVVTEKGYESTVRLFADEAAGEPEDLTTEALEQAQAEQKERAQDSSAGEPFASPHVATEPLPTGEAAPVPTIGERIIAAEAEALAQQASPEAIDLVETVERVDPIAAQREADIARAKDEKEANEKRLASGIEALDNAIANLTADLKTKKDRRKVLNSELMASILGHLQTSMDTEDDDEIDPEDTPVGKAISGQAPMLSEPPVEGMYRNQGAECASLGKIETDCPYTRETNAKGLSMWLDGFREAKREDHSEREAQVHALFRDALLEAALPGSLGILPPGEECPKIKAVRFDERPHLVVGMCAADENPSGVERWHLVPLFTRDEWSSGEVCPAQVYGDPVPGAHADPEKEAKRRVGGIDCGRMVKAGRSKLVVGPLQSMTVATTKPTDETPPH